MLTVLNRVLMLGQSKLASYPVICEQRFFRCTASHINTRSTSTRVTQWPLAAITGLCVAVSACGPVYTQSKLAARTAAPNSPVVISDERVIDPNSTTAFPEPLRPFGTPTSADTESLNAALRLHEKRQVPDDFHFLSDWLASHPSSVWRVPVAANLGILYYNAGYFSKALTELKEAWELGKGATGPLERTLVDRAVGELARMHARLGHTTELTALLHELEGRELRGGGTELVSASREALWLMKEEPGASFHCGPIALQSIAARESLSPAGRALINDLRSGAHGTNLAQLAAAASEAGLGYRAAYRTKPDVSLPLPAVVHWKVNHFAAVTEYVDGYYHVPDPTFGRDLWLTPAALQAESSGYFLLPAGASADGWRSVTTREAAKVYGMGNTGFRDEDRTTPDDDKQPCCPQPGHSGMPSYAVHSMMVSLNIVDTPLFYSPPRGPPIRFTLTYNQREVSRSANPNYTNWGAKWTSNWLSFLEDQPGVTNADVRQFVAGGGWYSYAGFSAESAESAPEEQSGARLVRTSLSPIRYEKRMLDGSVEVYSKSDGASPTRRIFLTERRDPQGNTVSITYDTQLRISQVIDAIGQASTFAYSGANYRVDSITDPFGRTAHFTYNSNLLLASIEDAIGLVSSFTYLGATDRVAALTTPFRTSTRTTTFDYCDKDVNPTACGAIDDMTRRITITDPEGEQERVEFKHMASGIASSASGCTATLCDVPPAGMAVRNDYLEYRNTFVWNKAVMKQTGGNPTYNQAYLIHWLHRSGFTSPPSCSGTTGGVKESEKRPLENRIWYGYPVQRKKVDAEPTDPEVGQYPSYSGMSETPSFVGRSRPGSSTPQLTKTYYNEAGRVSRQVDPAGNEIDFDYDASGTDVVRVKRPDGGTQTYTENFGSSTLPPEWVSVVPSGSVTVGSGVATILADPSNPANDFGGSVDRGTMLCRKLSGTPTVAEVTLNTTNLAASARIFMLRHSLSPSSVNLQISRSPTSGLLRMVTRGTPGNILYALTTSNTSYDATQPITARFEYDGWTVKAYAKQGSGAFKLLRSLPFANLNWVCLPDTKNGAGAQQYSQFSLVSPTYNTLAVLTYNGSHQPLTMTDALNKTTTFTYNAAGQIKTLTDALGHTSTWVYDTDTTPSAPGYLLSFKNATNQTVVQYAYDTKDRVNLVAEGNGRQIGIEYDNLNRVTRRTYGDATDEVFTICRSRPRQL